MNVKLILETAVMHVLAEVRQDRDVYTSAADIGRAMGLYETRESSWFYTYILYKLEDENRIESQRNETGKRKIGWRLTDAEWDQLTHPV